MVEIIQQYLAENGWDIVRRAFLWIWVFVVIYIIGKVVVWKAKQRIKDNTINEDVYTDKMSNLIWSIIMTAFIIFDILAVFQVIWFDVAILMWWISLWVGYAMETTISNMISGIMILTNKKINIWDFVEFFGKLNLKWTVEQINIRYSIIRTFDKRRIIVPNNMIARSPLKTFKIEPLIRWEVSIKLPRHVDFDQIKSLVIETINNIEWVLHKEFTTLFISWFDSRGIDTKAFFFACPQKWKWPFVIKKALWKNLLEIFRKYGISIPHEHMTITFEEN